MNTNTIRIIVDSAGGVVETDDETVSEHLRRTDDIAIVSWGEDGPIVGVRDYLGGNMEKEEVIEIAMDWLQDVGDYQVIPPTEVRMACV